jgi:Cu/Ag efflux pump CusA
LRQLPIVATNDAQLTLGQIADITLDVGPPMLMSKNGQLATYVMSISVAVISVPLSPLCNGPWHSR